MKALVCELCGSNSLIKDGEYYRCEACGTRYTLEDARKLLVEGTVVIDDSHKVQNYLELARQAQRAGNNEMAESYCDKALESDAASYDAWLLKAKSIGWQFTSKSNRLKEAFICFEKALELASADDEVSGVSSAMNKLEMAVIKKYCDGYSRTGDAATAKAVLSMLELIGASNERIGLKCSGSVLSLGDMRKVASTLSNAAARAWNSKIAPTFRDATVTDVGLFYRDGVGALSLIEAAISIDDVNDKKNLVRYENMMDMAASLQSRVMPAKYKQEVARRKSEWEPELKRLRAAAKQEGHNARRAEQSPKASSEGLATWQKVGLIILVLFTIFAFFGLL